MRILAYSAGGYHSEMSRATSSATGSRAYCSKNDGPGRCCSPRNASGTDRTSQSVDTSHRVRFFRMPYIFHMNCDSRSVTQKKSSYGVIINKYMLRNGPKTWVTELVSIVAACKNRQKLHPTTPPPYTKANKQCRFPLSRRRHAAQMALRDKVRIS